MHRSRQRHPTRLHPGPSASGDTDNRIPLPGSLTVELREQLTKLVGRASAPTVTVDAPFNGRAMVELPQCTPEDVLRAADLARVAQRRWAKVDISGPIRNLPATPRPGGRARDVDGPGPGRERQGATRRLPRSCRHCQHMSLLRTNGGSTATTPTSIRADSRLITEVHELRHPKGIVTIISPWNYPLSLGAGDTVPALLAGNGVVQKPDNQTAMTALFMLDLALKAGLPEGLWQIVLGRGSAIGTPLLDIADYIMFTGSTASGRNIAAEAGKRLVDCSAELGGKNPILILDDADLNRAVEGAVRASFSSSGQLCISTERMFVQDAIYDRFVPRFIEAVRSMPMGAAYDYSFQMGSMTSTAQVETMTAHVEDALAKGATLLCGGRRAPIWARSSSSRPS